MSCNLFYSIIQTEESPRVLCSGRPHISLLGYFEQESYKLLDQKTRTVFRLRDIIFEEDTTYLAK